MSNRSRSWLFVLLCGLTLLFAWPVFLWAVARVEVEPDTFLVVTNR